MNVQAPISVHRGTAEDKAIAGTLMFHGGVPTPTKLAIVDRSARVYPDLVKISTPDALRDLTFHEDHPQTPGLIGLTLPHWDKLMEINARAAQIFAPIRYQSTDIAITQDGPVIVELNYGGGFDLPQYASGRRMLTSAVRAFFKSHGCKFEPARRRGLLRLTKG